MECLLSCIEFTQYKMKMLSENNLLLELLSDILSYLDEISIENGAESISREELLTTAQNIIENNESGLNAIKCISGIVISF